MLNRNFSLFWMLLAGAGCWTIIILTGLATKYIPSQYALYCFGGLGILVLLSLIRLPGDF